MKECTKCKCRKRTSEFHKKGDGHNSWCKVCRTEHDRSIYKNNPKRREERKLAAKQYKQKCLKWWHGLKEGQPCADCDVSFHPVAMHWDHLPGYIKSAGPSELRNLAQRDKILAELEKCELVCANCHSVRTWNRTQSSVDIMGSTPMEDMA